VYLKVSEDRLPPDRESNSGPLEHEAAVPSATLQRFVRLLYVGT
jgi:hypothetical protein